MIIFKNLDKSTPYEAFKMKYELAVEHGQRNIEAMAISSFNKNLNQVDSRYVNLKFVEETDFIFFSNYNSPKSSAFKSHNQISALLYWSAINTQIRIKAKIKKTSHKYNQEYFFNRSREKNALAISSSQSKQVDSYNLIKDNFKKSLEEDDLRKCPKYWGGFSFTPYEIEFWEGHEFRLNKRTLYKKNKNDWNNFILEP